METLTLQKPALVESLQQLATVQNTTADTLLDTAVREFLDKWSSQKIQAESEAFTQLHPQLVTKYLGAYVAIHNGAVVDHDTELRPLHLRIRQRFGRMPVLLRQVNPELEARDLVFRSPRLASI